MAVKHQAIRATATTGPKACNWIDSLKLPRKAATVALVRKQVGHGMPVKAFSGQGQPSKGPWAPFSIK